MRRGVDRERALPVSVVVPAYNEEHYLGSCLAALRQQNYPFELLEIIVVDNGSLDGTVRVAQQYGVNVVHEPRKGVARARQTGFEASQGHVIASTDADTQVPFDWVARIAAHWKTDPTLGGVYGPVHWPDGSIVERLTIRYPGTWILWASNRLQRSLWWGSNFAVRREIFWEAGGFPVEWHSGEDTDLSLRVNRLARVRFDPQLVVWCSSRRMQEGVGKMAWRGTANVTNRFLLRRSPLPMPDIR